MGEIEPEGGTPVSNDLLTDEVWDQLDPHAGRLSRRSVRRWCLAGLGLLMVAGAVVAVLRSGLVEPRLVVRVDSYSGEFRHSTASPTSPADITADITLTNRGFFDVTVTRVGASVTGVAMVGTTTMPLVVPAGQSVEVTLNYKVTTCHIPSDMPIPVTVHRFWGAQTVPRGLDFDPQWLDESIGNICAP
jgi:hypothetical protein